MLRHYAPSLFHSHLGSGQGTSRRSRHRTSLKPRLLPHGQPASCAAKVQNVLYESNHCGFLVILFLPGLIVQNGFRKVGGQLSPDGNLLFQFQGPIMPPVIRYLCTQFHEPGNYSLHSMAAFCPMLLALLLMAACSTTGGSVQPRSAQFNPVEFHVGDIIETATGNVISFDKLIGDLSKVSIVYVGEIHTSAEDHKVQLEILEKLSRGGDA